MDYEPERPTSLQEWLYGYVELYWNLYLDFWELRDSLEEPELSADARGLNRIFNGIGKGMEDSIRALSPQRNLKEEIGKLVASLGLSPPTAEEIDETEMVQRLIDLPQVRDRLTISLAYTAVDELLPRAQKRAGNLVALMAARELSPRAAAFLDRATTSYLWGFDPECLVMCRSVLEAAFTTRLEESEVIDSDVPPPGLEVLIRLAGENQLLPGFQKGGRRGWSARRGTPLWRAERIRWSANRIVHDQPVFDMGGEALESADVSIQELVRILDLLFPSSGS